MALRRRYGNRQYAIISISEKNSKLGIKMTTKPDQNKQIKVFEGNFFEIGKQQGKIYVENGMNFNSVHVDDELYRNQLSVYKKYYPELLEEFEGMADSGNFDKDKLTYYFITDELFYFRDRFRLDKACTIFGYKNKEKLYVGRNYDWLPEAEPFFEVYKVINPKRNSFIAVTDMGIDSAAKASQKQFFYYNADDAINDKGLFVGITFAYADEWSYGLSCIHLTKLITETCSTVEEAIEVLNTVPLCAPKNFFIADKQGNMAVVESTSKKVKTVKPKDNTLIQTNHFVDDELRNEDLVLKYVPFHNTFIRYYETLQKINFEREKLNLNSVIKILGRNGSYTCQNFPGVKTIWTLALDMTDGKYYLYWDTSDSTKQQVLEI